MPWAGELDRKPWHDGRQKKEIVADLIDHLAKL